MVFTNCYVRVYVFFVIKERDRGRDSAEFRGYVKSGMRLCA